FTIPFGYNVTKYINQQRNSLIGGLSDSIIIEREINQDNQDIEIEKVNIISSEIEIFNRKMTYSTYGIFFCWLVIIIAGMLGLCVINFSDMIQIELHIMGIDFHKEIIAYVMFACMVCEIAFVTHYVCLFSKYHPLTKITELSRFIINLDGKKIDNNFSFIGRCKIKNEK
ncbi:unnamed protein product, partial [marine sediment metagenome]